MAKLKFLIIDVNTTTSYRIKKILNDEDIELLIATNSFETMNRITNNPDIDMIIIDVKLGAEDGYELIDSMKKINPDLVVLVLTSINTRRSFVHALKAGASDYVIKPFEDDYLKQKLSVYLENFEKSKSIPNYSPNQLDQNVYHAVKKAVQENYELLIGLIVIYHKNPQNSSSTNIKDQSIQKSLTFEAEKQLKENDKILHLGNNGLILILPRRALVEKTLIRDGFMNQLQTYISLHEVEDTFIAGEFINLPNEIDPNKNALSVLAKAVEKQIK